MKRLALFSCLMLAFSLACLAPRLKAEFEADLNRWVGHPIAEFIKAKEDPMEIKALPQGGKAYIFQLHQKAAPRDPMTFANPNGTMRETSMYMQPRMSCRLTLETDALGTILSTRWEGNGCW